MIFSVVILSYNSGRTLDKCLSSIIETFDSLGYLADSEVFVVDNGSTDNSKEILDGFCNQVPGLFKGIYLPENKGTTHSRNLALKKTTGEYVLVLDSDAYITTASLRQLKAQLDSNPKIGMVVPKLFYGDNRFQMSTDNFPTLYRKFMRFFYLERMQSERARDNIFDTYVDYAISACWLIRRDTADAVGSFDEEIFYSPEDVDYCIRVWESGFFIRYIANAHVVHDAQELSRGFKISFFHISHLKGLFYLFKKHRYFFSLKNLYKRIGRFA